MLKRLSKWIFIPLLISACASVSVMRTGKNARVKKQYPKVAAENVEIWASNSIPAGYEEIGVASFSTGQDKMERIYNRLREAAGNNGANAVFGFKMDAALIQVPQQTSSCDSKGLCRYSTTYVTEQQITVSGTLARRNP